MSMTNEINIERVYALIQSYGRIMEVHRMAINKEESILEKDSFCAIDVEELLKLRTLSCHLFIVLHAIAGELDNKHGVKIPGVAGWKLTDEDSFCLDPFPCPPDIYHF